MNRYTLQEYDQSLSETVVYYHSETVNTPHDSACGNSPNMKEAGVEYNAAERRRESAEERRMKKRECGRKER